MCIPKGGPNPDNAHAFINFILTPEVHGAIAEFVRYPCPNAAALEYIPEADRTDPAIYPAREVLEPLRVCGLFGREDRRSVPGRADPGARRLISGRVQQKQFSKAIVRNLVID